MESIIVCMRGIGFLLWIVEKGIEKEQSNGLNIFVLNMNMTKHIKE
jgi:hypothetical protein